SAGNRSPLRLDIELLLGLAGRDGRLPNPLARPGDVVSVAPAGSVLVDGWVEKPGSYPVTRGLTVSGALAAAGGQVFAADRRHATVKRVLGPGEDYSFTVDLEAVSHGTAADPPVVDGDVPRADARPGAARHAGDDAPLHRLDAAPAGAPVPDPAPAAGERAAPRRERPERERHLELPRHAGRDAQEPRPRRARHPERAA